MMAKRIKMGKQAERSGGQTTAEKVDCEAPGTPFQMEKDLIKDFDWSDRVERKLLVKSSACSDSCDEFCCCSAEEDAPSTPRASKIVSHGPPSIKQNYLKAKKDRKVQRSPLSCRRNLLNDFSNASSDRRERKDVDDFLSQLLGIVS